METHRSQAKSLLQTVIPANVQVVQALAFLASVLVAQNSFGYDQGTIGTCVTATVEKSATAAPNNLASFSGAVTAAFSTNFGGVFNLPTSVANNTVIYRGTYGTSQAKRLSLIPSNPMQNVTSSGSYTPVSSPNGTTPVPVLTGYSIALGPVDDPATSVLLPEAVVRLGFTVLSRTDAATFPADVKATVSFSDGTTESVTSRVGGTKGTDDTFYGFSAPSGLSITNLALASFSPDTTTPVSTKIAIDDIAFVTGWTIPPPQVLNVSPFNYSIAKAAGGVQFDALSYGVPIQPAGIKLVLNSTDVSSQLVITGSSTNFHVTFPGLLPNQTYDMQISVSNEVGVATASYRFYTSESAFVQFNSGGFSDNATYPAGLLQAMTNNGWSWLPSTDAAEIIDTGEPAHGATLRQMQMGNSQITYLEFPATASGYIRFGFDAKVSNPFVRTIDMGLSLAGSGTQASHIGWGVVTDAFGANTGEFAYYNGSAWIPLRNMDTEWHHYEMTNYISGPCAGTFDMVVDGTVVGHLIPFRNNLALRTAFGRLRLATGSGGIGEFGVVDNLIVEAGPDLAGVLPRPTILNMNPANYGVIRTTAGFQFDAFSYLPIPTDGISLVLNSNNVSSQLTITGDSTNRHVSFTGLMPNQPYEALITVTNELGGVAASSQFYSVDPAFGLFDSDGFSAPDLYPIGPLLPVGTNGWAWHPPVDAAQIADSGVAEHGPALRLTQMGTDQTAILTFSPVVGGVLRFSFDARLSNPFVRTLDFGLDTASTSQQASFISWGTVTNQFGTNSGQLAYLENGIWVGLLDMDTAWHHYELVHYCAGPKFAKYDLIVDGNVVGRSLPWRHAITTQTAMGRLRIGAIRGGVGEYGELDNILITVEPALTLPQAVTLLTPAHNGSNFSFSFQSLDGFKYVIEYKTNLLAGDWTPLENISGDGTVWKVTHASPPSGPLFYRVKSQLP